MKALLELLDDTLSPAVQGRLGLRYIDELPTASISEDVEGAIVGAVGHPQFGDAVIIQEQTAQVVLDDVSALLRFRTGHSVDPSILDIDVYVEGGTSFLLEAASESLERLHGVALSLFQACMRDSYLQARVVEEG
jgi:uncharacterized protein (TIGR04255 family)